MSENIKKLFDKLNTLKSDFKAKGLKLELETEIISTTEIELAKHLAKESGLELTLKTSGCSAVSDIFLANAMDIGNILSPMIESPYALEKFYNNVSNICNDNHKNLMFNLETITGLNNIDNILAYKNINKFTTLVFGRNDFCSSLGKTSDFCDNEKIFDYVKLILEKIQNTNLNLIIGGNITKHSFNFLKKIENPKFTHFETRKIIFDKSIICADFEEALKEALEFELLWLQTKSFKNPLDNQRKLILEKRF